MSFWSRIFRPGLVAVLALVLVVCQVPGRVFFLSRIWQGVPTHNLSPQPEKKFSLRAVSPCRLVQGLAVEASADGARLSTPVRPAVVAVRFLPRRVLLSAPSLLLGPPPGRSPPL